MRVIATEIHIREPDTPWLTAGEREQWCCEPGDPVSCRERTEDWYGFTEEEILERLGITLNNGRDEQGRICILYTSDAGDDEESVDLGGSRNIKKTKHQGKQQTRRRQRCTA